MCLTVCEYVHVFICEYVHVFVYGYVHASVYSCVHVSVCDCTCESRCRGCETCQKLGLQVVVSHVMWVFGIVLGSSGRSSFALNH